MRLTSSVAVAALAACLARPALADCNTCLPIIRFVSVVPEQRGVPTNFKPRVALFRRNGPVSIPDEVRLEDPSGNGVAGTWAQQESGWWQLTPSEPLQPDTRYVVADRYGHCGLIADCAPQAFAFSQAFYTGAGPKTSAPGIAGPLQPVCTRRTCAADDMSCCGPYDGWSVQFTPGLKEPLVRLTATAEAPGFGPVDFEVSREVPLARFGPSCSSVAPTVTPPEGELRVTFTAYDLAGNATPAPYALRINVSADACDVELDPPVTGAKPGCGCGAGPSGGSAALMLLALAVRARRRR